MTKKQKTIKELKFYDGVKEGWEEELWKLLEDGVLRSASCEPNEDIDESEFEQFFAGTRAFIKKLFQRFIEETLEETHKEIWRIEKKSGGIPLADSAKFDIYYQKQQQWLKENQI